MWTVTTNDNEHLVLIRSGETLSISNLKLMLNKIYIDNDGSYSSYNRFADLSCIKDIKVDFDTLVSNVWTYRGITPPANDIKVAVYIPYGLTYSLAETYGLLAEDETFKIEVLSSIAKCADYLKVDKAILQ